MQKYSNSSRINLIKYIRNMVKYMTLRNAGGDYEILNILELLFLKMMRIDVTCYLVSHFYFGVEDGTLNILKRQNI